MLSFLQNHVELLILLNLHKVHIQFLFSKLICTQGQWFPLTIEDAIITPLLSNLTLITKQNVLTPCFFQSLTFSIELVFFTIYMLQRYQQTKQLKINEKLKNF